MRADIFLVKNNFAKSRVRAKNLIESGGVSYNGKTVGKPSDDIPDDAVLEISEKDIPFVSRGGLKLQAALDNFAISAKDAVCVDIGSSTGGFCDCLLQNGAKKIYAFDVGKNQFDENLLKSGKIILRESFDARNITPDLFAEKIDIITLDVSFISQTLIYPAISSFFAPGCRFISLIKPQFEAGRAAVGKGGIIKDEKIREKCIEKIVETAASFGFIAEKTIPSPIEGGDGNREFLVCFRRDF